MSELKRNGTSKDDAAKTVELDDLGWKATGLFERSIPGLYDEVRRRLRRLRRACYA